MRVLIIEDDPAIAAVLSRGFQQCAAEVALAVDGEEGYTRATTGGYDVVVLDLMLPRRDGFEVLRTLRSNHHATPVICLTARDGVEDRIRGLDLGADDYLTKPFSFMELLARVRAVLRRSPVLGERTFVAGDLQIDFADRIVHRAGRRLPLSPTEYLLLEYLAHHHGAVVSRSMMLRHVWGISFDPGTNVVDVHINRLRRKLRRGAEPELIRTIRGVGYALGHEPQ